MHRESPLLDVSKLSLSFGGVTALKDLSLTVLPHEVVGLIGPNGSGKSTLFNCLSRIYTPDSGSIEFNGKDLLGLPPHSVMAAGMGRTFQNLGLVEDLSVLDNVLIGARQTPGLRRPQAWWMYVWGRRAERRAVDQVRALLDELRLGEWSDYPVRRLPYGLRKLTEIARAVSARPNLLLLDEPAAGLHASEMEALGTFLSRYQHDEQAAVMLVEHDLDFVSALCSRVLVLDFGSLVASGSPAEIAQDPAVIEAYTGEAR